MLYTRLAIVLQLLAALTLAHSTPSAPTKGVNSTTSGFKTLDSLYQGNLRFRNTARKRSAVARLVNEPPSFMFLGCTDNRLTPASIFQAPVGSIITQNNIANQYSKKDASTDASITYAIEELGVNHIIVLGHYGCKGISKAIMQAKEESPITKWIRPVKEFYSRARRNEIVKFRDSRKPRRGLKNGITGPPEANDAGFKALVEENVKNTVKALREQSLLAKAYQRSARTSAKNTPIDVYVHGFVHDESTGEVVDLKVSFGPPGKPIPPIPFTTTAAAKNFQRSEHLPNFFRGKTLKPPAYLHEHKH
jgi:carbonic anhydrase